MRGWMETVVASALAADPSDAVLWGAVVCAVTVTWCLTDQWARYLERRLARKGRDADRARQSTMAMARVVDLQSRRPLRDRLRPDVAQRGHSAHAHRPMWLADTAGRPQPAQRGVGAAVRVTADAGDAA